MTTASVAPSATQRRVLAALKRRGEASAEELAETLEISSSAVRQHLSALRSAGFIEARQERGQQGRPADKYHATELAEPLFANPDSGMSLELLEHIEEEDPELVSRAFERRRQRLVNEAKHRVEGKPLSDRITVLTELLDAQGYLASSDTISETSYRINLHSCAIWPVANRFKQACTAELDFIRDLVPDAKVERVTLKTDGAHTCAYEISAQS